MSICAKLSNVKLTRYTCCNVHFETEVLTYLHTFQPPQISWKLNTFMVTSGQCRTAKKNNEMQYNVNLSGAH